MDGKPSNVALDSVEGCCDGGYCFRILDFPADIWVIP